jgi:hypothetical protein
MNGLFLRLAAIVAFLLAGHTVLGGLYWALINVPESNVAMLALSALLVLLIGLIAGWIEAAAALGWMTDERAAAILRRAVRGVPAFLVAVAVFATIWVLTGSALSWHSRHSGEIDALLMSRFGWARPSWVHLIYMWAVRFVRWAVGLSVALSLVAAGAALGPRALLTATWLKRAFSPFRVITIGVLLLACFFLPWQLMAWRPRVLPPTSMEIVFVAIKLGLIAIVAHIGWALMLRTASH